MPRLKTESWGAGDQSWIATGHNLAGNRRELLDISTFTANTHFPDGYIKSGTAVALVASVLVPYNAAGSAGTDVLAGFIFSDQPVVGGTAGPDFQVPLYDHGRIHLSKLPIVITAPVAAKNATTIVFTA